MILVDLPSEPALLIRIAPILPPSLFQLLPSAVLRRLHVSPASSLLVSTLA